MDNARARVNSALFRFSGYHLSRGAPGELTQKLDKAKGELRRARQRADLARGRAEAAERDLQQAQERLREIQERRRARAASPEFPSDFDEKTREIITAVRPRTMTGLNKLHALVAATRYIVRYQVPGDIVECGVWRGGSMQAAALTLLSVEERNRHLYLFDTFEGMPPPTDKDVRHDGQTAADLLDITDRSGQVWAIADLDDVREGMAEVGYPADHIHYIKGKVEDTIPAHMPEQISILRLDTDWYESTAHELTHMWDRLVPGGVLMIDDYGHWAGSRTATEEFLDRTGAQLLLIRMNSGRVAIKLPA